MARKIVFTSGEYYHVFNRGVDKRSVFLDSEDFHRFLQCVEEFNTIEPIGSIYENFFRKHEPGNEVPKLLVEIVAYCLNPNHYHLILHQIEEVGISKFMHKLGVGYANYFNIKYERIGRLFQGPFKAVHVESNEQLLHLSVYVNLNNRAHRLGNRTSRSSWGEFVEGTRKICNTGIILEQFGDPAAYRKFAEDSLIDIRERKDLEKLFLE